MTPRLIDEPIQANAGFADQWNNPQTGEPMTNHDKLDAAGLINPDYEFSDEEKAVLETLTEDEIDALISVQQKVDDAKSGGQDIAFGILH
ncbi:MAG: hypothetical protein KA368_08890 [Acidobacteria bacterium]|nr:hypothetical protein [Acidobacteriota bacterium]